MSVYRRKDPVYARAKAVGYRSRAAFKLLELDKRFHLFRAGDRVVDLGAWPGGWLQVAAQRVGPRGLVIGVDVTPISQLPPPVSLLTGDVREATTLEKIEQCIGAKVDVVLSDMAPQLSGVRATDQARAIELGECALAAADRLLRPGGRFVIKLFQGVDFSGFLLQLRPRFRSVRATRPSATRTSSAEIYAVAVGFGCKSKP